MNRLEAAAKLLTEYREQGLSTGEAFFRFCQSPQCSYVATVGDVFRLMRTVGFDGIIPDRPAHPLDETQQCPCGSRHTWYSLANDGSYFCRECYETFRPEIVV